MEADCIVKTEGLTKTFMDFWTRRRVEAVRDLSIEIHRGEVFGLLGPNGSGKSTTVKMLLGLLFPTRGRVLVLGQPPRDVATKSRIGFLPEESYLYRFLNADETLDFYGRLFDLPKDERRRRAGELIERVGLKEARRRPLKEYSKGMARRIGLAQALINDPDFVILDEPTSGLDPKGRREMKDLILELRAKGKTVLLCSHLLPDVEDVCDRVAILNRGDLLVCRPLKDLLAQMDRVQILARNLPAEGLEKVKAAIGENRGEVLAVDHPTTTLEEVFLELTAARGPKTDSPSA